MTNKIFPRILCILLAILFCTSSSIAEENSQILIVDQSDIGCSDLGDGTSFCTIQGAIDYAAFNNFSETTITVKNGNYDGFVVYHDNITVESDIKHGAVIDGSPITVPIHNAPAATAYIVVGASNVQINGFIVTGEEVFSGITLEGGNEVILADQTTRTTSKPVLNTVISQNWISVHEYGIFASGFGCPQDTWGDTGSFAIMGNVLTGNNCGFGALGDVETSQFRFNQVYNNINGFCFFYPRGNYIDARNNWWGDSTGPGSSNPDNTKVIDAINKTTEAVGDGDPINCWGCGVEGEDKGGVAFAPWCEDESCITDSITEIIQNFSSGCIPHPCHNYQMQYDVEFIEENRIIIDAKIYFSKRGSCNPDVQEVYNVVYEWEYEPFLIPSTSGIRLFNPKVTMHLGGSNSDGLTWWCNFIAFCGKSLRRPPSWVRDTDIDVTGLDCRNVYNIPDDDPNEPFPGRIMQPESDTEFYVGLEFFETPTNKVYTMQQLLQILGISIDPWCEDESCIAEFTQNFSSGCIPHPYRNRQMQYDVEFIEENRMIVDAKVYYGARRGSCNPDVQEVYNVIYEWEYEPFFLPCSMFGIKLFNPKVTMNLGGYNSDGLTWWYNFIGFCGKGFECPPEWVRDTDVDVTGIDCSYLCNLPQGVHDDPQPGKIVQPNKDDVWYIGFGFYKDIPKPVEGFEIYTLQELLQLLGIEEL